MYIRIKGDSFTENIYREIAALTDRAILHFGRIEYDEEKGVIQMPIDRFRIKKRKKIFRMVTPYSVDKSIKIPAIVKIRHVTGLIKDVHLDKDNLSEIPILFGLKIRNTDIFVGSAEEFEGLPCFALTLKVDMLDLEICDIATAKAKD